MKRKRENSEVSEPTLKTAQDRRDAEAFVQLIRKFPPTARDREEELLIEAINKAGEEEEE